MVTTPTATAADACRPRVGRLAVAADPVPHQGQEERGHAHRLERRRVDDDPGEEAADRTEDGAAQERDGADVTSSRFGVPPITVDRVQDGDLDTAATKRSAPALTPSRTITVS